MPNGKNNYVSPLSPPGQQWLCRASPVGRMLLVSDGCAEEACEC